MTVGSSTTSTITPGTSIELGQSINQELVGTKRRSGLQTFALLVGGAIVGALITGLIILAVQHGRSAKQRTTPSTDPLQSSDSTRLDVQPLNLFLSNSIPRNPASSTGPTLQLDDFLSGYYYPNRLNATWISSHELLYRDEELNILTHDVRTQTTSLLLANDVADVTQAVEFKLSPDRRYVLMSRNVQRVFRHSSFAFYDAIEVATKKVFPIAQNASAPDLLQLVEWSTVGNALVFVQNNNIFYKPTVVAEPVQLTEDGGRSVYYGVCDWVYEEEIFASKTALWFSPDGKRLAFVRFDDTSVPVMNIPFYGDASRPEFQYSQLIGLHYPKVGAPNPIVTLYAVDLSASQQPHQTILRHEQTVPTALRSEQPIITAVGWQTNDTFVSTWMNRVQNRAVLQACRDSTCTVFKEMHSADGWLDLYKMLQFNANGTKLLLVATQDREAGGYRHVTLMSTKDGAETALTSGEFEVTHTLHWDAATDRVFYLANVAGQPEVQHLHAVKAQPGQASDCLTCNLLVNGVNQTYFTAEFSSDRYVILTNEGPGIPQIALYEWSVDTATDRVQLKQLNVLDANDDIRSVVKGIALPTIQYMDVPLDHGNFTARVRIMTPPQMDRSGKTVYPMLVNVYAGPDSYNGHDKLELGWASVLVSTRSIVHVQINGRGSSMRGDRLRHAIYRRFGQVEVDDQIEVTGKLTHLLPFVDAKRVAIWGWSYGGFTTALALAKDSAHIYRCAASVAPVTDFTLYDSIYTERFMGLATADDNAVGYAATRVSAMAHLFHNRTYFLIHGTFDDNVHYQQSMALARNLELNDVMFRQMSYPDEGHSLGSVQKHLYHTLGAYFDECFAYSAPRRAPRVH